MERYDSDGYRADGRKRISGYSREIQGGADEARARSDARRNAHYTSLPNRGISAQMGQFRNPDGSVKADLGVTVPSHSGGTKTIMPRSKAIPRAELPATIQRPAEQSAALDAGKRMVDKIAPPVSAGSVLNELMTPKGRKRRTTRVMRPVEE